MELKYIVAIIGSGVFLIIFCAFLIVYFRNKKKNAEVERLIEKMYADKNLDKMEYDSAAYDEETKKIIAERAITADDQLTIEEFILNSHLHEEKKEFEKIVTESMEEITGNYKADNGN